MAETTRMEKSRAAGKMTVFDVARALVQGWMGGEAAGTYVPRPSITIPQAHIDAGTHVRSGATGAMAARSSVHVPWKP